MTMRNAIISFPAFGIEINPPAGFDLFGRTIYLYGVMAALGFILGMLYCTKRAKKFGLQMTSGSDNHCSARISDPHHQIFGIALNERLTCIGDYVRLIRSRQPIGLRIPENRFDTANCPQIESFYVDGEGGNTPTGRLTVNDWMK